MSSNHAPPNVMTPSMRQVALTLKATPIPNHEFVVFYDSHSVFQILGRFVTHRSNYLVKYYKFHLRFYQS